MPDDGADRGNLQDQRAALGVRNGVEHEGPPSGLGGHTSSLVNRPEPGPAPDGSSPDRSAPGAAGADGPEAGRSEPAPAPDAARKNRRKRITRLVLALLVIGVVVALALRAPSAVHDFTSAFKHIRARRLPWLAAALAAEFASFWFYARLQRTLLVAGGEEVSTGIVFRLSIASTGLRELLPAGAQTSSGWLYEQYRKLGTEAALSAYVVLASGFFSTTTIFGLLLVAAAIAGVGSPLVLALSGAVLVVGSAAFVAGVHRLTALERLVAGHTGRLARFGQRILSFGEGVAMLRPGLLRGALAFADAAGNWLADVVCLVIAFVLLGQPVPWHGLLFAYCAAQLAGSIVPLPGGIGAVEGGLVGGFVLTGEPVGIALAATLIYRVVTYWGVALIGGIEFLSLVRHPISPKDVRHTRATPCPRAVTRADDAGGDREGDRTAGT